MKYLNSIILYPTKLSLKEEKNDFLENQKWKEYIAYRPALQEMIKGTSWREGKWNRLENAALYKDRRTS